MTKKTSREKELNKLLFQKEILLYPSKLKSVLQYGADPNVIMHTNSWYADNTTPITTLLTKHYEGDTDKQGESNCMEVLAACKTLVEAGADLFKYEVGPDENEDEIRGAIQKHILDRSFTVNPLILYLEKQGIDFANLDPSASSLMYARSPEIVKFLLDKGVNPNGIEATVDYETLRPLMHYVELQHDDALEMVKLLVDAGAEINIFVSNYISPLFSALNSYHFQIAEYLLDNGADPLALDDDGNNVLHWVNEELKQDHLNDTEREGLTKLKARLELLTNK